MINKKYAEYKEVFNKSGYHTEKKGALYFFSLLDEVRNELKEGFTDEEIKEKLPSICLEEYHFYFEIRKSKYIEGINDFLSTRNKNKQEIVDSASELSLDDALLVFAKYFNNKELEHEKENGTKK